MPSGPARSAVVPNSPPDRDVVAADVLRRAIPNPSDSLLPLCARPRMPDDLSRELGRRIALVDDWDSLLTLAEEHGLGPLLYRHLLDRTAEIPGDVTRRLLGLYARHRRINDVFAGVLEEILATFEREGIGVILLKGLAVGTLVYDDLAVRPLADLDLLVDDRQAVQAQGLLGSLGFVVHMPTSRYRMGRNHHLRPASRVVDGVPIFVEVHLDALSADRSATMRYTEQRESAEAFDLRGRRVPTLERHEMLWHLCRHMVGLRHPFRLVWVADVIGYAERFADELDWPLLRKKHPFVLSALSLLQHVTPLPETVVRNADIAVGRSPSQVCVDYIGWPRSTALVWDGWSKRFACLQRSVDPPEWWLRLAYGAGCGPVGQWPARLRHAAALTGLVLRRAGDLLPRREEAPSTQPCKMDGQ